MRKKKKNNYRKNKKIYKIIWGLSFIVYIIFLTYVFILNMIPDKYLVLIIGVTLFMYLLFMAFMFGKRVKKKIKVTCSIILIIFTIIFGIGIKYINDTVNFLDVIDNKLLQKANYYVMVLDDSKYKELDDLLDKKIGIYSANNSQDVYKKIEKNVKIEKVEYSDVEKMLTDLKEGKIDSVLVNDSIKTLISSELSDMEIKLRNVHKVTISIEKEDIVKYVDITKKKFNVYIAGGDAFGSIQNDTDVNMIATVDPVNNKILLTSIPRDYYVNLPSFGENAYDKLTHAGYYGIEESVKSVEKLLDIDINYYVKVNFSTVVGIIDAIGGVDVESDYAFTTHNDEETRYYKFKKGMNHLNGEEALAFARERMSFADGDVQRVKDQQKVISAIINKVSSSTSLITKYCLNCKDKYYINQTDHVCYDIVLKIIFLRIWNRKQLINLLKNNLMNLRVGV